MERIKKIIEQKKTKTSRHERYTDGCINNFIFQTFHIGIRIFVTPTIAIICSQSPVHARILLSPFVLATLLFSIRSYLFQAKQCNNSEGR